MNFETILKQVQKPGRYTGGEYGSVMKELSRVDTRVAFCFPDTYEIGMSNLGVRLLQGALNEMEGVFCERVYAPWVDMEEKMREHGLRLWAHESREEIASFDFICFTLQYELCYTNVLNMLELAGLPLLASARGEDAPVVVGGGPCAYNAEPIAEFFDAFSIGEGEEALPEMVALYRKMKKEGRYTKTAYLRELSHIPGFYVPSLYEVTYKEDGCIASMEPRFADVPRKVVKRIVADLDKSYYPEMFCMPYIETVQDRIVMETYRGCSRGCRFCQACMLFRPIREKTPEVINAQAKKLVENTGYDEITLSSLSISDYRGLEKLTDLMLPWTDEAKVSLSLPSLRVDSFTKELMDKITTVRTGGITFAPEAGTQRLRDVINKNVVASDLLRACRVAFEAGKNNVKLYFMNGLPTETMEDIEGIYELANAVVSEFYHTEGRNKNRPVQVTISVACFVPKPFTAFQWEGQDGFDSLLQKQQRLAELVKPKKQIRYTWHDARVSRLEAVFARGNRKLSRVLLRAHECGLRFDGWDEMFDFDTWMQVFADCGVDPSFYANREMGEDEILPWDVIDCGVTKEFLLRERHKAYEETTTPGCLEKCAGCGANKLGGVRGCCPGQCE